MAILTAVELAELRQEMARRHDIVTWTKPQINAAFQALENTYEAVDFKTPIDSANPFRFSISQQAVIKTVWNNQKAKREGF